MDQKSLRPTLLKVNFLTISIYLVKMDLPVAVVETTFIHIFHEIVHEFVLSSLYTCHIIFNLPQSYLGDILDLLDWYSTIGIVLGKRRKTNGIT